MADGSIEIPSKLPVILVTDGVLYPSASLKVPVRTKQNRLLVESYLVNGSLFSFRNRVVAVAYKSADVTSTKRCCLPAGFESVGTAALVESVAATDWPTPAYALQLRGLCRVRFDRLASDAPFVRAVVVQLDKFPPQRADGSAGAEEAAPSGLLDDVRRLGSVLNLSGDQLDRLINAAPLHVVVDVCASLLRHISYSDKLVLLTELDLTVRAKRLHGIIKQKLEELKEDDAVQTVQLYSPPRSADPFSTLLSDLLSGRKPTETQNNGGIQTSDHKEDALLQKLKAAKMSAETEQIIMNEYQKMQKMTTFSPEYTSLRNYLELVAELPWSRETKDALDVQKAARDLDADHFGLADVKRRILEYLAVRQLRRSLKGPIMCFVGPPGVGKTSVAKSVAKSLNRAFHRISLGGVSDQSDIRGHRRTYIGSMPGRIMQGLKVAATRNPVFLLDEIDKLRVGVHGDPAAALLEVLDAEQNGAFVDHYLNVPFDLSQVLFIATANTATTIPAALLDRMEVITIPGYTHEDKVRIAARHLLPKLLAEHGLRDDHLTVPEASIAYIVERYTREAGVRTLERRLAKVCRTVALKLAQTDGDGEQSVDSVAARQTSFPIVVDAAAVDDILGAPTFFATDAAAATPVGVAAGLAWTPVGGEVLFVETSRLTNGRGRLTLTGQLGDVMKESVRVALNWLRSHADTLGVESGGDVLESDVHVHLPAGAISKDGPSAGITVLVALVSLFAGRSVRGATAMTGEITLRGRLLPVGGIKEKLLAANRAGYKRIVMPKQNESDLRDIDDSVKQKLDVCLCETMEDAIAASFGEVISSRTRSHL